MASCQVQDGTCNRVCTGIHDQRVRSEAWLWKVRLLYQWVSPPTRGGVSICKMLCNRISSTTDIQYMPSLCDRSLGSRSTPGEQHSRSTLGAQVFHYLLAYSNSWHKLLLSIINDEFGNCAKCHLSGARVSLTLTRSLSCVCMYLRLLAVLPPTCMCTLIELRSIDKPLFVRLKITASNNQHCNSKNVLFFSCSYRR